MSETPERLAELTQENGERLNTLRHKGLDVNILQLTLVHLIEHLFPTEEEREAMNLAFQERLSATLDEAEKQADLLRIQTSGLVVPGL